LLGYGERNDDSMKNKMDEKVMLEKDVKMKG
jgi:hypothetical protein